jgi:cyclic pyranopterin phosphate synthase
MAKTKGMVDVSKKEVTLRIAEASGTISLAKEAFEIIEKGTCKKGDVLSAAKIAAVHAVKLTPSLIAMCHTVLVESVDVEFILDKRKKAVTAVCKVKSSGKTGVEMEALCGVSSACLTIYDMLKYTGFAMTINNIVLLEKEGGKSGHYKRQNKSDIPVKRKRNKKS